MLQYPETASSLINKLILGIVLSVWLIPSMTLSQEDLADVIAECEKSLVRIKTNSGTGSGYVVSKDGMFVTNVHVLAGAARATLTFPDDPGNEIDITGTYHIDEERDICVGQLQATGLTPIRLASDLPRKGEGVTALGSPMGLEFTATNGIVGAIRDGAGLGKEMRMELKGTWIQVDAALSPENSGGPLINKAGEVVAMSTLASGGGRAQNLNFGISIDDIKAAIEKSKNAKLVTLGAGIAKVDSPDGGGGGGAGEQSMIRLRDIPDESIQDYISRGKAEFKTLSRNIRVGATAKNSELKIMKRGIVGIPNGTNADIAVLRGRTKKTYYFRSESLKQRVLKQKEAQVTKLKTLKSRISGVDRDTGLAAILVDARPMIDAREKGSVGFMDGARVIVAFNDHEIAVEYGGTPFLMWVESTTGLSSGEELSPSVVFVAGTETIRHPSRGSISVTVLQEIPERKLLTSIENNLLFKEWKSGKFSVEAKLIKNDGTTLTLEKRDGSSIDVPLSKLDAESQAQAKK